jgi:hypothetical protein
MKAIIPDKFLEVLSKQVNPSAMQQALKDYEVWANAIQSPSNVAAHCTELLKCAEQRSGNPDLRKNRYLSELIIQSTITAKNKLESHKYPQIS